MQLAFSPQEDDPDLGRRMASSLQQALEDGCKKVRVTKNCFAQGIRDRTAAKRSDLFPRVCSTDLGAVDSIVKGLEPASNQANDVLALLQVVLVGSDIPDLSPDIVEQAFHLLDSSEVWAML